MEDIEYYDIPVYNFPYDVEEDDEETIQDNSELRVSLLLVVYHFSDIVYRAFFLLLSLDPRKKLKLMASQSALASTRGVSLRSTILSTVTLVGSGVPC